MTPPPRITVIVLNWNGKHHLQECLDAVLAQNIQEPFDVMVWDNGSTDGSQAFVKAGYPQVTVHDAGENLGFAKAMNRAIAMVNTPYVVLLNNDTRAEANWLRVLVRVADESPADVFSVGSRLVLHDRPDLVNHAGARFSPFGGAFDEGFGRPVADFASRGDVYETGASCGGAALYRRDLFLELGGFDERFFLYFEDADLCRRAWIAGYRVLHAAKSVVRHKFGGTTGSLLSPLRLREGQKNRVLMLHKCSPTGRILPRMLSSAAWTGVAGLYLVIKDRKAARAWYGGAWQGVRVARGDKSMRRELERMRKRSETEMKRWTAGVVEAIREAERLRRGLR